MELLREIWATAQRNKLRTALTGFAVAWGIFMLIFLLGAGNGLINAQTAQQNSFMTNSIRVFGGQTSKAYNGFKEGREIRLDENDVKTTQKLFTGNVDEVGAEIRCDSSQTVSYGQNYIAPTIKGVAPEYMKIEKYKLLYGRFINEIDMREQRKVIVLSKKSAKELDPNYQSLVGKYVKVNKFAFRVIGIYKEDDSNQSLDAFAPYTTFRIIYGTGDKVGSIVFSFHGIDNQEQSDAFEKSYGSKIKLNHNAAPDDGSAIWLWNRYSRSLEMSQGMSMIRTALWVIGLLTLLSGIVGISNIMLITVKERTHEFGIRKAIGAKPWSILKLIIVESVIITSVFGYIGMLCGIMANEWMDATIGHKTIQMGEFSATMFLNPTVGLDVCFEATLVMIIAGTIAGLIPARKAAKIRPIEALNAPS